MSIFQEVKEYVTARQVAEHYGLKVNRNGMACCPFHDDRHPSMKLSWGYYCFACGARGDAIGYVAQMFGLSQYEAALKLIEDFSLPIETDTLDGKDQVDFGRRWKKEEKERKRIENIKERFGKWCSEQISALKECEAHIRVIKEAFNGVPPDEVFASEQFSQAVNAEPYIENWLDILCHGSEEDRQELFIKGRKEVGRIAGELKGAVSGIMESDRGDTGYGNERCG